MCNRVKRPHDLKNLTSQTSTYETDENMRVCDGRSAGVPTMVAGGGDGTNMSSPQWPPECAVAFTDLLPDFP